MEWLLIIALALLGVCVGLLALTLARLSRMGAELGERRENLSSLRRDLADSQRALREELNEGLQRSIRSMGALLAESQSAQAKAQGEKLGEIQRGLMTLSAQVENRLKTSALENEQKLENIRATMEQRLGALQADNNKRLEQMQQVVDEKLQKTLDERMAQSFKLVNERLEQVYKGLGEMQTLAVGVGDLKKVLSNVKTRGTLGEIQLEAILSEILAPEQYEKNTTVSPHGRERVEFAIRLPAQDDSRVLLPIDSKFPTDAYGELVDAYEAGDPARIKAAQDSLVARIRGFARDIRDKYINPPYTTEFAIMFLPTEGLYAEAVRLGLVERLQRECQVNLAGPSTMAALLNSLQMGFRTVAIQKRSGEVWKVLGAVKTEFDRFHEVLTRAQKQLTRANNELDTLIGVRTRRIQSRLKDVTAMPAAQVPLYLPEDAVEIMDTDDEEKEE